MTLLILADIHANYAAFRAALDAFPSADEIWCLGDLVEFGPSPAECVALARERCALVVQGNHDAHFLTGAGPWASAQRDSLPGDALEWLRRLPTSLRVERAGLAMRLVHGTPANPLEGKLYPLREGPPAEHRPASAASDYERHLAGGEEDLVLCGHTHVAMRERFRGVEVVNAGTVGQPRDGDPRAQCLLFEDGRFRFERVEYDLDALWREYERAPLPAALKREWFDCTRRGLVDVHGLQLSPFSPEPPEATP